MAVYVDDMRARLGLMVMCHMVADTTAELLDMADLLGLRRDWLQKAGTPHEHFDISLGFRERAVKLGAVEITMVELGRMLNARRERVAM